jgi:hypothetical protein
MNSNGKRKDCLMSLRPNKKNSMKKKSILNKMKIFIDL